MFSEPCTPGRFFEDSSETRPPTFDPGNSILPEASIIQAKLNRRLGPEYVSQRPSPGGGPKLTYIEGWKIIGLANEVFGYNGWCSNVTRIETDFIDMDPESRRCSVGITAVVRVTLKDGTYHEDIGYGTGDNLKSKGAALDKVRHSKFRGQWAVVTVMATGEERSRNRRCEARPPEFWKSSWSLSLREVICPGGRKDQAPTCKYSQLRGPRSRCLRRAYIHHITNCFCIIASSQSLISLTYTAEKN